MKKYIFRKLAKYATDPQTRAFVAMLFGSLELYGFMETFGIFKTLFWPDIKKTLKEVYRSAKSSAQENDVPGGKRRQGLHPRVNGGDGGMPDVQPESKSYERLRADAQGSDKDVAAGRKEKN
jgi:hypothetical protein